MGFFYKTSLLSITLWIFLGILIHDSLYSFKNKDKVSLINFTEAFKYEANMQKKNIKKSRTNKKSKTKKKKKNTEPLNNKHHKKYIKKLKEENDSILDKLHNESYLEENYIISSDKSNDDSNKDSLNYKTKIVSMVEAEKVLDELTDYDNGEEEEEEEDNEDSQTDDENSEIIENDKDEKNSNKKCNEYGKECLEDVVLPFVTLMKNINKLNVKTNNKKKEKNMENIYDDEHHTIKVYDEDHDDDDLYDKYKNSKKNNIKTNVIEGTEYLGIGYDFIFGNPIGDPFLNVDPGYRDTIVKLTYPKSDIDYPKDYLNINPNGSYVRNEISCTRSEKDTEISSMSEYSKELSVDASVSVSVFSFASFSASAGYQSTSNSISKNKDKMFMLKSYCFKYVASLSQYSQWKLTDQFKRAISILPAYFNSLQEEGKFCNPADYKVKEKREELCGPSVEAWMNFFKDFGTHVSTIIHLGGKITQTLKISKSEFKSLEEEGVSVSVSASGGYMGISASASTDTNTNTSNSKENKKTSIEKDTVIIGGITIFDPNNPKHFEKWADSIKNNAMPIKGEYEPLSRILPLRLVKIYDEALEYYVYVNSPQNIETISNDDAKTLDLRAYLENAELVSASGPGLQMIQCNENKNFILGFSISVPEDLNDLEEFSATTCDGDQDKCFSKMGNKKLYNYIFALCSKDTFPFLEQKVKSEKGEFLSLECSQKDQVILFGFGLSILNSHESVEVVMHNCAYGKRACSIQGITHKSQAALWIVCGHVDTLNSKFTTTITRIKYENIKKKKRVPMTNCKPNALINLLFEFSNINFNNRSNNCFKASKGCIDSFADTCYKYNKDVDFAYYSLYIN